VICAFGAWQVPFGALIRQQNTLKNKIVQSPTAQIFIKYKNQKGDTQT